MVSGLIMATPRYEEGCIGSLLLRPDLFPEVVKVLPKPEMFFLGGPRRIYEVMLQLAVDGKLPDGEAVLAHLARRGKFSAEVETSIHKFIESQPTGDNAVCYARDVRTAYRDREAEMKQAHIAEMRARGADAERIAAAVKDLHAWLDLWRIEDSGRTFTTSGEAIQAYIDRLLRGEEELLGLGISELDRAIGGGVRYGDFVVFAAPSNHCKSSFALHVVHFVSLCEIPSLVVSAEMSAALLGKRTLQTQLDGMSEHDYAQNVPTLEAAARDYLSIRALWHIDDRSTTLKDVLASIDTAVAKYGVRFVAIDYLQMIECPGANRLESVSRVSSALRDKAKEHGLVILALCQMNNQIMRRPTFQPKAGDIEYGPQIYRDADLVIFGVWPHRVDETQPADKYDFYLAKSRDRPLLRNVLQVNWDAARQIFYGLSRRERNAATGNQFAGAFEEFS